MRLNGSPDGCDAAARQLQRAAREVSRTAEELQRAEVLEWTGTAALGWERLASERVRRLREAASVLGAVGRAVAQHADALRVLQSRTGRLTADAAQAGLHLDDEGWIAPVPLPASAEPEAVREALHRREVRRRVMAGAEQVRVEEARAHDLLLRELARGVEVPPWGGGCDWSVDVDWLPGLADLPSLSVSASQLAAEIRRSLPSVLRHAGASAGLGFGVGIAAELSQDKDLDDAVTKNVVTTGVAVGTGLVVTATAPAWVPAAAVGGVAVAGGAAVAYGAGKVFDKFGHHLPWVERPRGSMPAAVRPLNRGAPRGPVPRPVPVASARPEWTVRRRPPQPRPQFGPAPSVRRAVA